MNALGRQHRLAVVAVSLVMGLLLHEYAFWFVAAGAGYRIYKRDFPDRSYDRIAYAFLALVVANGLLSWFCSLQAQSVFGHSL